MPENEIRVNDQNMVIILGRYQVSQRYDSPLEDNCFLDIRPVYQIACHRADVVILKDGNEFTVLKHRYMFVTGQKYHKSSLTNIIFAR